MPECETHTVQSGCLVSRPAMAYTMSVALCAVGLFLCLSFIATPRVASHLGLFVQCIFMMLVCSDDSLYFSIV